MFISNAYAQTAAAAPAGGLDSILGSPFTLIGLMVLMFFMVLRPQMKRQKEQRQLMEALGKGDEVVTAGGILGKVKKVTDAYVVLEIAEGTEVIVQKNAISMLLPGGTIKSI